jgi:hypothetical protein
MTFMFERHVVLKSSLFRGVKPCSLVEVDRRFGGT